MPIMTSVTSGTKRHYSSAIEEADVSHSVGKTDIGDSICYGAVSFSGSHSVEAFLMASTRYALTHQRPGTDLTSRF